MEENKPKRSTRKKAPTKRKPYQRKVRAETHIRRSAKSDKALEDNTTVTIHVRSVHIINNVDYGPGEVTVPAKIARTLRELDQRVAKAETDLMSTKSRIVWKPKNGPVRSAVVADGMFDNAFAGGIPGVISVL